MGGDLSCYQALAHAVVLQTVTDYRSAMRRLKKHPDDGYAIKMRKECEDFFLSQRFDLFTTIDGRGLLENLRKEFE